MNVPDKYVLDASLALAWCFEEESTPFTEELLSHAPTSHLLVPSLWHLEITNVFTGAERHKKLNRSQILTYLGILQRLPLQTIEPTESTAFARECLALAVHYKLTAYDSTYLHLALEKHLPLITLDKALQAAAKDLGVGL